MKDKLRAIFLMAIVATQLIAGLALNAQAADVVPQELEKSSIDSDYLQVPSDHAAMHRATLEAQSTIGKFIAALKNPEPGQRDFEIKKTFIQGSQTERLWLSDVRFVSGHFQGRIDDKPRNIGELKLGQLVSVNTNKIDDWLYVDNGALVGGKGILVGGYTIRAHYKKLSPKQKQEFNREADFQFGKQ
jgi:uncharacterized protein YegJ (DUF2314 family)